MRRETLDRAVLPVAIPVAAIIGIVFFVFFFSRILLAVAALRDFGPILATAIALGMALNVLTACALVAALPRLRTTIVVVAVATAAVLLGSGGVLAMVVSPEARLGGEAAERGPEHGPPGGGGGGPGPSCEPSGNKLAITAPQGALSSGFDTKCLAAPAGKAFKVEFKNEDSAVHNWALFRDPSAQDQLGGATIDEPVASGESETYKVDALEPGRYFYRCDFHPTVMTGTFVVK
jgi:plastocyanin